MAIMQSSPENLPQTLRPLVLFCLPEERTIAEAAADFELPAVFSGPDFAVSWSAQQQGWLRRLAMNHRTFCQADCESLVLRLNSYDLLIANPLSLNTLAKFALGLRDSFPAELLWQFSALGKPILLAETCLPDEKSAMNPHLIRIYRRHWQTITSGTISGFNNDNLSELATRMVRARAAAARQPVYGARVFVTRDDIIAASETLEPLKVPFSAIITDAAREEAQARNVVIVQGN
ncbi:MAG: hypothetical protein PHD82_15355 [Candidatus Riflebacteria bacterium]|jgi:hypothetical protein|nr:hypothetical protein [Candidatus Riflebacteria bacterium]